eukprot:EG_transcript_23210
MALPPHCPVKYGPPTGSPPEVPAGTGGAFHPSADGRLWLFQRRWEPAGEVRATLMILHGTVDHSGAYAELARGLAAVGVAVFASDMRGWGLSDGEALYFHDLDVFLEDIRQDYWRIHEQPRYAHVPHRFLLGKSIGGLLSAHLVARHPDLFTGLIGLSGAYEITGALPPAPVMWLLRGLAAVAPKWPLRPPFPPELIVSDTAALEEWRRDDLCAHGNVTVGYIVTAAAAVAALRPAIPGIAKPLLMLWGTGDRVVSREGHQLMVDASGGTDKALRVYEGGFHN